MGTILLSIPQSNQPNSTEDPKIASDLTTIQNTINGGLDATNLTGAVAQSAGVNGGANGTVKGSTSIAGVHSTPSTSFVALSTPDQVAGIVLPTNGLIAVYYQATWSTNATSGVAGLFLGANQVQLAAGAAPVPVQTTTTNVFTQPLSSASGGLNTATTAGNYSGDVTTGQLVGTGVISGGPVYIFASAGTYTVSIRFKVTGSGSVFVTNRQLWVQALAFA